MHIATPACQYLPGTHWLHIASDPSALLAQLLQNAGHSVEK